MTRGAVIVEHRGTAGRLRENEGENGRQHGNVPRPRSHEEHEEDWFFFVRFFVAFVPSWLGKHQRCLDRVAVDPGSSIVP
jgi:hypothetical protein